MSFVTNKAFTIAVGIFVTIAIASGILIIFSNVNSIYGNVRNKDISLSSRFNEYDMYNNTEMTGLDVINTARKYALDGTVRVIDILTGEQLNIESKLASLKSKIVYHDIYKVTVELVQDSTNKDNVNVIKVYKKGR